MTIQPDLFSYGVRPVQTQQACATPGSPPRRSPPSATVGQPETLKGNRNRRGRKLTHKMKPDKPLVVMHWNAEGVFNKKDELQNMLRSKDVDICCIQETHLK